MWTGEQKGAVRSVWTKTTPKEKWRWWARMITEHFLGDSGKSFRGSEPIDMLRLRCFSFIFFISKDGTQGLLCAR